MACILFRRMIPGRAAVRRTRRKKRRPGRRKSSTATRAWWIPTRTQMRKVHWDVFLHVQSVPFIHTDLVTCGSSSLSQLTGRSCGSDVWDRDQAETHRWAGEQPAAAPDAEEPVWGETDSAPEQDQRHTAGERPRAAQPQWASAIFTSVCGEIVSVVCDVFLAFLQGKSISISVLKG